MKIPAVLILTLVLYTSHAQTRAIPSSKPKVSGTSNKTVNSKPGTYTEPSTDKQESSVTPLIAMLAGLSISLAGICFYVGYWKGRNKQVL